MSYNIVLREGQKIFDHTTYIELYRIRRKYFIVFRDRRTGRFTYAKPIYRRTLSMKPIPIHDKYYGAVVHLTGSADLMEKEDEYKHKKVLIKWIEEHTGYIKEYWWFTEDEKKAEEEKKIYLPINKSDTVFWEIPKGEEKDLFYEVNMYHKLWEKDGWLLDEELEAVEIE